LHMKLFPNFRVFQASLTMMAIPASMRSERYVVYLPGYSGPQISLAVALYPVLYLVIR
jgi:hypothetical protein